MTDGRSLTATRSWPQLREEPDNLHLLGGYGPLLVGAVLLVMMVLLAPTIAPEQVVQTPLHIVATTGRRQHDHDHRRPPSRPPTVKR